MANDSGKALNTPKQDAAFFPGTGMPDMAWWRALWPDPAGVIRAMHIERRMRVLDLGCGPGYFTAAIAQAVGPAGRAIGVDLDPAMLELARAACAAMDNCEWVLGDAMEVEKIVLESVDYALIANTFHGAPDKTALAGVASGVLRLGGHFGVINWHPIPREQTHVLGQPRGPATAMRMSVENTRDLVERAGLKLERVVELPPYHYGAIFVREG